MFKFVSKLWTVRVVLLAFALALSAQNSLGHDTNGDDPDVCPAYQYIADTHTPLYRLTNQQDVEGLRGIVGEDCSVLDGVLSIGEPANYTLGEGLTRISDLSALHWLRGVGALKIENVPALVTLSGLHHIREETESIIIRDAPKLQNIDALGGIGGIRELGHGPLGIAIEQTALKTLQPIRSIPAHGEHWGFVVRDNPLLSDCEWPDSGDPPESPLVSNNLLGCNSVAEVLEYWGSHRHDLKIAVTPGGSVSLASLSPGLVMKSSGLETGDIIKDPSATATSDELGHWGSVPVPSGHSMELRGDAESGYEQVEIRSNCFGGKQYDGGEKWIISSMSDDCYFFAAFLPENYPNAKTQSMHPSVCRAVTQSSEKGLSRKEKGLYNNGDSTVAVVCPVPRKLAPHVWDFVANLFEATQIPPESWGRFDDYITDLMDGIYSPAELATAAFTGDEYTAHNRSDEEFVSDLYRALLNRPGMPEGIAYWNDLLSAGVSRSAVLREFLMSAEFEEIAGTMLSVTVDARTDLELSFYSEEVSAPNSASACRIVRGSASTDILSDSITQSAYFRVPGLVLSSEPIQIYLGTTSTADPLNSYVLACQIEGGAGLANISVLQY